MIPYLLQVTEEAKRASASARIVQLAKPKNHTGNGMPSRPASNQDEEKESPRSNKTVTASARTEELAGNNVSILYRYKYK